ncbi:MAG: tRNA (adenosine(37)-N6)-dimethylallyltransferase MiaA [Longimicrobiales bacterium]
MADDAIVIAGATATGKTALGIALARTLNGEVVSMDSRQVYRSMDIGTAKPTLRERRDVPHHGFDLVTPDGRYSAGRFGRDARRWIRDIRERGRIPILVGGTGFFLRALTHPLFREPDMPRERRSALDRYLRAFEMEELRRWSAALDPALAARRTGADRQRHARAIEVALLTGRPLSWWHRNAPPAEPALALRVFVLELPPDVLRARIDTRVHAMMETGLVEEVAGLLAAGHTEASPGMSATGYAEILPYLRGEYTLGDAVERIQAATRRYARRQRTWLRHQLPEGAVRLDGCRPPEELAARIARTWREENP